MFIRPPPIYTLKFSVYLFRFIYEENPYFSTFEGQQKYKYRQNK